MIRHWKIFTALALLLVVHFSEAENERSYDNNDWIPITPSAKEKTELEHKKATGRVLNLDAPAQKFFPEDFRKKPSQQYLRETYNGRPGGPHPRHKTKSRGRPRHPDPSFSYDNVGGLSTKMEPPPNPSALQYFTNNEVKLQILNQPPPPPSQIPQQYLGQNFALASQIPQQVQQQVPQTQLPPVSLLYDIPINSSLYETINPVSINQEILDASKNVQLPIANVPNVVTSAKPNPQEEKEKETVQLLYVPLENLKDTQPVYEGSQRVINQAEAPRQEKLVAFPGFLQDQRQRQNIEQDFIQQALHAQRLQEQIQQGQPLIYQTTTPKPKKRKPHQPPLAVYMDGEDQAEVTDVLDVLKDAKTISVQDTVKPDSPKVFIGPSNLNPPKGYTKFPLPYLNNIEGNRIERKIEHLPFFVAPLSYKTPPGYSKIPLPSPHVGSVVISNKNEGDSLSGIRTTEVYSTSPKTESFGQTPNSGFNQQLQNIRYQLSEEIVPHYQTPKPQEVKQYQIPVQEHIPQYQIPTSENIQQYQPVQSVQPEAYNQYQVPIPVTLKTSSPKPVDLSQYTSYAKPSDESLYKVYSKPSSSSDIYLLRDEEITRPPVATVTPKTVRPQPTQSHIQQTVSPQQLSSTLANKRPQTFDVNPLDLAINQYELQQINSQFYDLAQKQKQAEYEESGPSTPQYQNGYARSTTTTTEKPTRRRKPTQNIRTTPAYDNTKYTVLEEFTAGPTTQRYPEVQTEVAIEPAVVYKQNIPTKQEVKTPLHYETYTQPPRLYKEQNIEHIPANVYRLNPQPDIQSQSRPQSQPQSHVQPQHVVHVQPVYTENRPSINQHILNQDMLDKQILSHNKESEKQTQYFIETSSTPEEVKPLVHNRGQGISDQPTYYTTGQDIPQVQQGQTLSGYLSNSQDSSIKSLLVPQLLVPTTDNPDAKSTSVVTEAPTTEAVTETTTTRRTRGRVRGSRYTTTTSSPRRTSHSRRRINYARPTTERSTTAYASSREEYKTVKPRFRTRGRPLHNSITERASTPSEPPQEAYSEPQSYAQFEQSVQQTRENDVTSPGTDKDYQAYSLTGKGLGNLKNVGENGQISEVQGEKEKGSNEFRYISSNSGGVLYNTEGTSTPTSKPRQRGRVRGRSRFTTTQRIVTTESTTTTTTTQKPQVEEENGEYYGFIRQPNFNKDPEVQYQEVTKPALYSVTYQSSPRPEIQYSAGEAQVPVQFLGEIRPKYVSTPEYDQEKYEEQTEAPQVKIKTRTRTSTPNTVENTYVKPTRGRGRGSSHYRGTVRPKQNSDDEDVIGGNYPAHYLRQRTSTEAPSFQITVSPLDEEVDDQASHSSYYSPSVQKPDTEWIEASAQPFPNQIYDDQKVSTIASVTVTEQPFALPVVASTEQEIIGNIEQESVFTTLSPIIEDEVTEKPKKKNGRRRGVWRLVKQRPVDQIQTAESQNYRSVLNELEQTGKDQTTFNETNVSESKHEETTTVVTTTSEHSIFDKLYDMFGLDNQFEGTTVNPTSTLLPSENFNEEETTTLTYPPSLITEQPESTSQVNKTEKAPIDLPEVASTISTILDDIKPTEPTTRNNFEVEPWEMRVVKTSTSTEVSHQTEICYRGRCVKSDNKKSDA